MSANKDDGRLIKFYQERIESCKAFARTSLDSPAEVDLKLPTEEWIRRRNEAMLGEICFTHLQEEFEIMKPHYLEVGYSQASVDYIEGEINKAAEDYKK